MSTIPACRLGARRVTIRDAQGTPMAGRQVRFRLANHRFLFGCGAFETIPLTDPATDEASRRLYQRIWEAWRELFNYGTLPFYWGEYEPTEGQPRQEELMRGARFLQANQVKAKGHPLCWHTRAAEWLMPKSDDEVESLLRERITREVTAFRGLVDVWDVVNEMVIMPEFDHEENAITRLCQKLGRVELAKLDFTTARAANPDAVLILNDFNTSERYRQHIEDCLNAGVPIDVIGIQSHQHQGPWGLEKLHRVVERYVRFGLPIHFTENTFISGQLMPPEIVDLNDYVVESWPSTPKGEDDQAHWLLEMADYLFAHPAVEAFTTWCMVDDRWLHAPAGLLRADGSRKPAFEALKQRITEDWHTDVTLMTDEHGECQLSGVQGDYDVLCDGLCSAVTLEKETKAAVVTMV